MEDAEYRNLLQAAKQRALKMDSPHIAKWQSEIRTYLQLGDQVPRTIDFEVPRTIRQAQEVLQLAEARLDRVIALHHDAKRALQIIASVETQLVGVFTQHGDLPRPSTAPAQQQLLAACIPELLRVRAKWQGLEAACAQAQRRLGSIRETIKLQAKLDDNLRWAQERSPG